jgi:hypothetical protein
MPQHQDETRAPENATIENQDAPTQTRPALVAQPQAVVMHTAVPRPEPMGQGQVPNADDNPKPGADDEPENQEEGEDHDPDAPYGYRLDGTPRLTKGGRPPKKSSQAATDEKAKQRARLRSVSPGKGPKPKIEAIAIEPLVAVNYQAMGEMVAGLFFNVGVMVLGEEWAPDVKEGEHLAVAGAFRDYFKATNMRDLPPGFALVAVLSLYTLKRVTKPTIKQRLQGVATWLKAKMPFRKQTP